MRIGIAVEKPELEKESGRRGVTEHEVLEVFRQQGRNIDEIKARDERQRDCTDFVIAGNYQAEILEIEDLDPAKPASDILDFVVAVGGEHHYLKCAHLFEDAFLVGVNSDPRTHESDLIYFDRESISEHIQDALENCFGFEEWTRMSVWLNGNPLPDAISTVAILASDHMTYCLRLGLLAEEQQAAGFFIVTGAGSGRGSRYLSAGLYLPHIGSGLFKESTNSFSRLNRSLRTLTAEPRRGRDCPYHGLNMRCQEKDAVSLTYCSPFPATLSIDGLIHHTINEGDHLMFKVADNPVRVVVRSN